MEFKYELKVISYGMNNIDFDALQIDEDPWYFDWAYGKYKGRPALITESQFTKAIDSIVLFPRLVGYGFIQAHVLPIKNNIKYNTLMEVRISLLYIMAWYIRAFFKEIKWLFGN